MHSTVQDELTAVSRTKGRQKAGQIFLHCSSDRWGLLLKKDVYREFKLRVIRQTANARQRKILRYQAIGTGHKVCVLGGVGWVEGIPKFYHKIWHPPPPPKGDEMFRPPPPPPAHPTNHPLPKNIKF
jgi:hypothetical protein